MATSRTRLSQPRSMKLNPKDYTIGLICSRGPEALVPVWEFLDEEHDDSVPKSRHDCNSYTFGRIGEHNVVIAGIPEWQHPGAERVSGDMQYTFPHIKICFLVGAGSGAPANHDIRLGDVVVCLPSNESEGVLRGVLRYEHDGTLHTTYTGHQGEELELVATAISSLKATYEREGHHLDKAITDVLSKNPRLRKYQRPEAGRDRLYKSDVVHTDKRNNDCVHTYKRNKDCGLSCGNDGSKLVFRDVRSGIQDEPVIHYGRVASGLTPIEDALLRDRLSQSGVLCFDTDAFKMASFPFLVVVRGICDYADTHKDSLWQGYASFAAAAYVRDLLHKMSPGEAKTEVTPTDSLSNSWTDISSDIIVEQ
ncbi:hypothetical protein O1611_g6541 [Lasiodiplodia mahajangana]|uniref:Uncharacterized protein n=1 Tax=Lasiodiplodia mahajangana TaxID=1108764 RepID=A0ACC2JI28_9PEZI|nr:hypothetical protein O1611_g6541 [Lasiodiplodia mahajangana]